MDNYTITNNECLQKGLDLTEYVLDTPMVDALIELGKDLLNTRILKLNDNLKGEQAIYDYLGNSTSLIKAYKKAQHRVLYNLIFMGDNDPLDNSVNDIIVYDLGLGKINGFQKGWF